MNIIVFDTETTGLDPTVDKVIEYGFAVFNVDCLDILYSEGAILCSAESNPAQNVNGISKEMLERGANKNIYSESLVKAMKVFSARTLVAHNVEFDRKFTEPGIATENISTPAIKWVDSIDMPFPRAGRSRTLSHLAIDHGIIPVGAHRALQDVYILCELFKTLGAAGLKQFLSDQDKPIWYVMAEVSYDNRNKAKGAGFKWNPVESCWSITVRGENPAEVRNNLISMGARDWGFNCKLRRAKNV
jgi:DNA polymerase-3 subunit epsilon